MKLKQIQLVRISVYESSVESFGHLELLLKECEHQISADGKPCLGLYRVGARAVVVVDSQPAFDPAEEQPAPDPSKLSPA